jgi:hypothetical protein
MGQGPARGNVCAVVGDIDQEPVEAIDSLLPFVIDDIYEKNQFLVATSVAGGYMLVRSLLRLRNDFRPC